MMWMNRLSPECREQKINFEPQLVRYEKNQRWTRVLLDGKPMRTLLLELLEGHNSSIVHLLLLLVLCAALYFPYLGSTPFFDKGEPREALAVQDIVQRGEWLVPLKRGTEVPSKPPLFHWSAALVTQLSGSFNEATIRFSSSFYAILTVLLVCWFGRQIFNAQTALLAAVILATMLIYQNQALSARVDMTLCFFVTLTLVLFYSIYTERLKHPLWLYVFYTVAGIGTLAKGPLGIVLPTFVAGVFALVQRRWDIVRKFAFHPGVLLMLALASAWYAIAVARAGPGFFDRQIVQENLRRFIGGSGHSHPVYYYVPYLFFQTMPWSFFLPLVFWDLFQRSYPSNRNLIFLKLWLLVMFLFFSISLGKRPVYLLPLYPAASLLFADWFYNAPRPSKERVALFRIVAVITGVLLLVISIALLSSRNPGWFLSYVDALLKPKDHANVVAVRDQFRNFGGALTALWLLAAIVWLSLARAAWHGRMRTIAHQLVVIAFIQCTVGSSLVMPVIAHQRSYKSFMNEVNRRIGPDADLFLYGRFNSDAVVFYRGRQIERLDQPLEAIATRFGHGHAYVIMPARRAAIEHLPPPLVMSDGGGPEGDAQLVLMQADLP
jgi:4-amino-4-deoxy-L-arabinose transferase-like glycosyltransferase